MRILNLVIVTGFVICAPWLAFGCECPISTAEEWFVKSDLIFEGTVVKNEPVYFTYSKDNIGALYPELIGTESIGSQKVTFDVNKVYKGDVAETATVQTNIFLDHNGYPFLCGEEYVVYASRKKNTDIFHTSICPPTRPLDKKTPGQSDIVSLIYGLKDNDNIDLKGLSKEHISEKLLTCVVNERCILPAGDITIPNTSPPSVDGKIVLIEGNIIEVQNKSDNFQNRIMMNEKTDMFTIYGGYVAKKELFIGQHVQIWYVGCDYPSGLGVIPLAAVIKVDRTQ